MRRYTLLTGFLLVILSLTVAVTGGSAAPQASKPASVAKTGLTSQQLAALQLAWNNLSRGYADLQSTPPDVKGDTSKLEGHMRAALNELHLVDPQSIQAPPANIPVEDKGRTRAFILGAVKGHLDKARSVIEGAKVTNTHVQQALQNIVVAQSDLTLVQQTAAK